MKSTNAPLVAAQSRSLREALEWRFRLSELGDLQLVPADKREKGMRTRNLIEEAMSKLSVHYRWLSKWTLPTLQLLLSSDEVL
jgi:hypothetical protein